MNKATSRSKRAKAGEAQRGSVKEKLAVASKVKLEVEAPAVSRFRLYKNVAVQDFRFARARRALTVLHLETQDGQYSNIAAPGSSCLLAP